ncbi:MAG: hypothetical protein RIT28_552, partial [Pseudomonadota bacterium]
MLKDKDLKEIQALIDVGKQRGYVTHEEMSTILPTHLIGADQIDDVMIMFSNMDIEVVNQAKKRAEAERRGLNPEQQLPESAPAGRSNDPVRMYLRKMGRVSLLSRDGEIEIAKRIEEGETAARRLLLTSSIAANSLKEIIDEEQEKLDRALRNGKKPRASETTRLLRLQHSYHLAVLLDERRKKLHRTLARSKSRRRKDNNEQRLAATEEALFQLLMTVEIEKPRMQRWSRSLHDAWRDIARHEAEINKVAREAMVPVRDLRRSIR